MRVLVTGGFGNVGMVVVAECLRRGHGVTVFEVRNRRTERLARRYARRGVTVRLGDLRDAGGVARAVAGQDAAIHLAAILPPVSEERPELCMAVNVGGTANLVAALQAAPGAPALVQVSSASVMGPTQDRNPPVRPEDFPCPTDAYSRSKVEAEALVAGSGLRHTVLRLAAVMPTYLVLGSMVRMARLMFDLPLDARCEVVLDVDAAHALVSAAEDLAGPSDVAGRTGFLGGGAAQGCQMRVRDMLAGTFGPLGLEIPDAALFPADVNTYYLDWYDTEETQRILRYQRHTFREWQGMMRKKYALLRPVVRLLRAPIVRWLAGQARRGG